MTNNTAKIRAANKRTLRDIHDEIRMTKAKPEQTREFGVKWLGLLPAFVWDIFFWFIFKNPHWLKKSFGTVGMTSVMMVGVGYKENITKLTFSKFFQNLEFL